MSVQVPPPGPPPPPGYTIPLPPPPREEIGAVKLIGGSCALFAAAIALLTWLLLMAWFY
ncbi:hypothetical protein ACWGF3_10165 [Streptomyces xanthophaeus]|uniref:Uncharacterized protein n=1 Tax=Streptomyces xanthophaeus TaxID=67385 RepID=A0A919L9H8_9ACTN|nr:hypothetical protein [Streptomyces xanthophaeus]GHI83103.1 hypothetical protein Sxan_04670 [Streptomyces xanthophaeus]